MIAPALSLIRVVIDLENERQIIRLCEGVSYIACSKMFQFYVLTLVFQDLTELAIAG